MMFLTQAQSQEIEGTRNSTQHGSQPRTSPHKETRDPVLLQPYLYSKEGQPETRRMEQTEVDMMEPMRAHKSKFAQERKPVQGKKKPPTKPQQQTLLRTLTQTASCKQYTVTLSTKMMAGILTGA